MAKDPATTPRGKADAKGKADPKGKAAGATKATKAKKPKRPRGERWKQLVQAYKMTYARDKQLPWWMALAFIGTAALIFLLLTLVGLPLFASIPVAVMFGVLGLLIIFGRRAQKAAFSQVEGQPGAARTGARCVAHGALPGVRSDGKRTVHLP